eukprot:3933121-Rhodomonas_salina.2
MHSDRVQQAGYGRGNLSDARPAVCFVMLSIHPRSEQQRLQVAGEKGRTAAGAEPVRSRMGGRLSEEDRRVRI